MNLLPKCHEEFSKADYWNTFFKKRGKKAFEWYGEYPELCGQLSKFVKTKDDILVVGCGNSKLSMDLYDVGYSNIMSIDISKIVIDQMIEKNREDRPNLVFEQMDATQMSYPDGKFSVVLDKGTLDALMPDNSEETDNRINKFFDEISRVLRRGGRYICISLLQEHILRKIIAYFSASDFMLRITRLHEAESRTREEEGSAIPVFAVMASKFPGIDQKVLELELLTGSAVRASSEAELVNSILAVQQSALVCDRLQKKSVADVGEVNLDLHVPGNDNPRYTIFVLDRPRAKGKSYAAFLVPQGRDSDWLFATAEGRRHFLTSVDKDRVAIVILRREHKFEDWSDVKSELGPSITYLAPSGLPSNYVIDYLSLGSDVGQRVLLYRGESKVSGKFVVEDILGTDPKSRTRRLIFLDNQFVVQSEALVRSVKSRRKKAKFSVDPGVLGCEHHAYMSIAVNSLMRKDQPKEALVIGLGGGGLCLFLHHCFLKLKITAVDIDEAMLQVATDWFDFVQDDRTKVCIADGIEFLKTSSGKKKFDAILFDVDSKDTSLGMSCPPKQFLESSVLSDVTKCLNEDGLFVLNLVCRDKSLRPGVLDNLKKTFASVTSIKIETIVNEILICSKVENSEEVWKNNWKESLRNLNQRVRNRNLLSEDVVDVTEFLNTLTIEPSI